MTLNIRSAEWVVRGDRKITPLLTSFALPRHPLAAEAVRVRLSNARAPLRATTQRIDDDHANAKRKWQALGALEYLTADVLEKLNTASLVDIEQQDFTCRNGAVEIAVVLAPLSVTAVTLYYESPVA